MKILKAKKETPFNHVISGLSTRGNFSLLAAGLEQEAEPCINK